MIDTVIIEPIETSREDHNRSGYRVFLDGKDVGHIANYLTVELEPGALPLLTLRIPMRRCMVRGPIGMQFEEDDSE